MDDNDDDFFNDSDAHRDHVETNRVCSRSRLEDDNGAPSVVHTFENDAMLILTSARGAHTAFETWHGARPLFCLSVLCDEMAFDNGVSGQNQFTHRQVKLEDDDTLRGRLCMAGKLVSMLRFIEEAVKTPNACVIIHCYAGISRSATVVLAYFMVHHQKTLDEALTHVKQVRPMVNPNHAFYEMLRALEKHSIDCIEFCEM